MQRRVQAVENATWGNSCLLYQQAPGLKTLLFGLHLPRPGSPPRADHASAPQARTHTAAPTATQRSCAYTPSRSLRTHTAASPWETPHEPTARHPHHYRHGRPHQRGALPDRYLIVNEAAHMGTCARVGCMPSKALIEAANAFTGAMPGGVCLRGAQDLSADIAAVLQRVRTQRNDL